MSYAAEPLLMPDDQPYITLDLNGLIFNAGFDSIRLPELGERTAPLAADTGDAGAGPARERVFLAQRWTGERRASDDFPDDMCDADTTATG